MAASSDAGFPLSDAATPRGGFPSSSSARPRGPPSESAGAQSDIGEDGFEDDQIPGGGASRRNNARLADPKVDSIGSSTGREFEIFLEKYVR